MTPEPPPAAAPSLWRIVPVLGVTQILAWASSYYLPAVIAKPIADSTGWPLSWVVGGLSIGLLASGIISPRVGRTIEQRGGRPVLAVSSVLLALGLSSLALSRGLPVYVASWIVIGLGMGSGLYDAAFATLGRTYGEKSRQAITALTLFGGFASTVGWPLSAYLVDMVGWRGTCWVYAALQLGLALPIYSFVLQREEQRKLVQETAPVEPGTPGEVRLGNGTGARFRLLFILLAAGFTLGDVIWSVLSVHLITILQARNVSMQEAVALGALVGPSQVSARVIELLTGRFHHPIWTMIGSAVLVTAGVALLWAGGPLVAFGFILYGAGGGIRSIARGTLPLALFGSIGYAVVMGRLAMPSLLAQSVSPMIAAWVLERLGAVMLMGVLMAVAACHLAMVAVTWAVTRQARRLKAEAQ
jgi:Major Facilitator Superfamily